MKLPYRLIKCLAFGFVFIASSSFAKNNILPSGWRMPHSSELNDDWRRKDPDKYSIIRADFNGDGLKDRAMLLVSIRRNEIGLFVFLSRKGGAFKTYKLDVVKGEKLLQAIGIAKVLPGQCKTACGKGYWECGKGDISDVSIKYDAINYFKAESAALYFYWDERSRSFKRMWISD